MSVMDELVAGRRQARHCGVKLAMQALPKKDAADFAAVFADRRYTYPEIARVLTRRSGVEVGKDAVGRHVRKECTCARQP